MKRIIGALLLTGAVTAQAEPYDMVVTKVTDGDTIRVDVSDWVLPELGDTMGVRIMGIDTPEKGGRAQCEVEAELGAKATEFAKSVISVGDTVQIEVVQWDKYGGRFNGIVMVNGENFAQMQIDRGLAKPYDGGTKESWCD